MVDTTNARTSNEAISDLIPETGSPEIEITPAMIEAGVTVLWESGAIETPMDDLDRNLVRQIFLAMFLAQQSRS
jgi:hypothetical protein